MIKIDDIFYHVIFKAKYSLFSSLFFNIFVMSKLDCVMYHINDVDKCFNN